MFRRNFKIKKEHGIVNFKESSSQRHYNQKANKEREEIKKRKPEKIFILKVSPQKEIRKLSLHQPQSQQNLKCEHNYDSKNLSRSDT